MRFFPFFLFGQIMATSSEAGQADSCVQATGSKPSAGAGSGGGAAEVKVEGANGVEKKEPSPAGAAAAAVDGQSQAKKEKKQEDGAKQRLRILCVEKGLGQKFIHPLRQCLMDNHEVYTPILHHLSNADFDGVHNVLKDAVKSFKPDMIVACSKGCKFALWLVEKNAFKGPVLILSPYIIPFFSKLPTSTPISFVYGTKDDMPTSKFRALAKSAGELTIVHELTGYKHDLMYLDPHFADDDGGGDASTKAGSGAAPKKSPPAGDKTPYLTPEKLLSFVEELWTLHTKRPSAKRASTPPKAKAAGKAPSSPSASSTAATSSSSSTTMQTPTSTHS